MKKLPSREYLAECFSYDCATGLFRWRERPLSHFSNSPERSALWKKSYSNSRFAGKPAFSSGNGAGHRASYLDGQKVYAHRVAWKLSYGDDPAIIDHINGDPNDNRLSNLRSVTHQENLRNTKLSVANTTGVKGVSAHQNVGYNATIHSPSGKPVRKWFKTMGEASAWRSSKEIEFGYMSRAI